jgi:hypothetical protein
LACGRLAGRCGRRSMESPEACRAEKPGGGDSRQGLVAIHSRTAPMTRDRCTPKQGSSPLHSRQRLSHPLACTIWNGGGWDRRRSAGAPRCPTLGNQDERHSKFIARNFHSAEPLHGQPVSLVISKRAEAMPESARRPEPGPWCFGEAAP